MLTCTICAKRAMWQGRRSKGLPWEPLCVLCASGQGERLEVRRIPTKPDDWQRWYRTFMDRHPDYYRTEEYRAYRRELRRRRAA